MAVLMVVLDEKDREWRGPPKELKNVYSARLDIASLELTDEEVEQHTSTLVKMLLLATRIPK